MCRICTEFTRMMRRILNFGAQNSDTPRYDCHSVRAGYCTKLWQPIDTTVVFLVSENDGHGHHVYLTITSKVTMPLMNMIILVIRHRKLIA